MRLPRMTMRRWMIAVAVVAALLGAELARRRIREYRFMASEYKIEAVYHARSSRDSRKAHRRWIDSAQDTEGKAGETDDVTLRAFYIERVSEARSSAESEAALAQYQEAMRKKYERAAGRPWESVPPDPPEPSRKSEGLASSRFLRVPPAAKPHRPSSGSGPAPPQPATR